MLDASRYTTRRTTGSGPYPAYAPAAAQFYIPAEPVSYPHWFAVRVANVDPSKLAQSTADSLDGHGPVSNPGKLAEYSTVNSWRARLPKGTAVSDQHTQTGYGIIGLRTSDGGALLFYTDAAVVTFTAPRGKTFQMPIPGVYSSKQRLGWAGMRFLDQPATYDPPRGAGNPRVVANYSGIQGRL
ncbi:MAG TPA: hypothetical protein VF060_31070 [Trebonia sp.]